MTTHSNNFLKFALAILLLSNSGLLFYIFKQEQNQKEQNSELINLNTKLDLVIKNNFEKNRKNSCLNVFVKDEKTQELKPLEIYYIEDIVTDVTAIEAPKWEEEVLGCGFLGGMQEPMPEKGMQSFYDYISQNINYPINAKRKGIEGKVTVSFIINKKGEITEVEAKNDIGGGCKEEAERVIKNAPKWKPAKQRGKTVKTRLTIPIVFKLDL
jgi:protein TonB